jgi:hypothetical protein
MKQEHGLDNGKSLPEAGAGMDTYLKLEQGIERNLNLEQGNRREPETGAGMNVHLRLEQEWILNK